MKKTGILIFIFFNLMYVAKAQDVRRLNTNRATPFAAHIVDVWPTPNALWVSQLQPNVPARLVSDTLQEISTNLTGVNPFSNPLIGAYPTVANEIFLAFNQQPGYFEGILGPANGGVVRFLNGNFLLYNSQNTPPFNGLRERLWYAFTSQPNSRLLFISGDSGIRRLNMSNFQVKSFYNDSVSRRQGYFSRAGQSKTGVWFMRHTNRWVWQTGDTLVPLVERNFNIPDSMRIIDLAFRGSDTLFLIRRPGNTRAELRLRNNGVTNTIQLPTINDIAHLAVEKDSLLWLWGNQSGLFLHNNNTLIAISDTLLSGLLVNSLKIDEKHNKWLATKNVGLVKVNNIKAAIEIEGGKRQFQCRGKKIKFRANATNLLNSPMSYSWEFMDGTILQGISVEKEFTFPLSQLIKLRVTDLHGAENVFSDTIFLQSGYFTSILPRSGIFETCSSLPLSHFWKDSITWILPNGTELFAPAIKAESEGKYVIDLKLPGCKTRDSIIIQKPTILASEIALYDTANRAINVVDTIFSRLPLPLVSEAVGGYCQRIWLLNNTNIGSAEKESFTITEYGTYELNLTSENGERCSSTSTIKFVVAPKPPSVIKIPNLVTRNRDNKNEFWEISGAEGPVKVQVYNRFGKLLFSDDNYQNNWPKEAQSGVYFYHCETDGQKFKGWVEVVK
jgi:gliding motility-associated-like protein